jgi:hypothetical protein
MQASDTNKDAAAAAATAVSSKPARTPVAAKTAAERIGITKGRR